MKNLQLSDYLSAREAAGQKTVTRRLGEKCRYRPGDVVYFGEALKRVSALTPDSINFNGIAAYRRDGQQVRNECREPHIWIWRRPVQPARFCPAVCGRRFGRILSTRRERLGEMTEAEAVLEGFEPGPTMLPDGTIRIYDKLGSALENFHRYWRALHDSEPLPGITVWRIEWVSVSAEVAWKEAA